MLAYIKSNYKTGDTVQITCSEGLISGEIEFVSNKYIVLRQPNGQIVGIAAEDVRTFTADCPVPLTPAVKPATQAPAETDEDAEESEALSDTDATIASEAASGYGKTADYMEDRPTLEFNPKVVGKINLAQVDPKYGKRSFFRSATDESGNTDTANTADTFHRSASYSGPRKPYVSARGRITYYNAEKRYGFIHDYTEDADIYFHQSQVVDSALYDELYKGTKVAYTLGKNTQGLCAYCLHLPCTAESLMPLAEDLFDSRRYQQAQSILQQILDADPDNTAAKDLLEDIRSAAPAIHDADTAYVPSPLYAQAKKLYLAKRVDEAEEAYLHAIEAGERVESCVKDLVTLYVSRYKQTEDPEEKANCKKKAMDFLDSHRDKLADTLTTKQFLALNYYLSLQEYDSFIAVVDEILQDPTIQRVSSKHAFYIWQKAIVLNKLGRRDDALALIDEGLAIAPTHHQLRRLQQYILYPEQQGEAPVASSAPAEDAKEGSADTAADKSKDNAGESSASSEDKGGSWWQQTLDTGW